MWVKNDKDNFENKKMFYPYSTQEEMERAHEEFTQEKHEEVKAEVVRLEEKVVSYIKRHFRNAVENELYFTLEAHQGQDLMDDVAVKELALDFMEETHNEIYRNVRDDLSKERRKLKEKN